MIVNGTNIRNLTVGFQAAFQGAFSGVQSAYGRFCTTVNSTTAEEDYGWLGDMPQIREWIGERVVHNLTASGYAVKNRPFELTIGVPRSAVEDDRYGIYATASRGLGEQAARFPDKLVFGLMADGWTKKCYDGQPFFSTDHPTDSGVFANTDSDADDDGAPWFLFDDTQFLRPWIYQQRKPFAFVAKTDIRDDNVFFHDQYLYGVDGRCNVGFGLPQLCWGSKQPLNADNYEKARAALGQMKGSKGDLLGVSGKVLVVGSTLERAALKLLNNEKAAGGEDNEWKGTARLEVIPFLPGPSV